MKLKMLAPSFFSFFLFFFFVFFWEGGVRAAFCLVMVKRCVALQQMAAMCFFETLQRFVLTR